MLTSYATLNVLVDNYQDNYHKFMKCLLFSARRTRLDDLCVEWTVTFVVCHVCQYHYLKLINILLCFVIVIMSNFHVLLKLSHLLGFGNFTCHRLP